MAVPYIGYSLDTKQAVKTEPLERSEDITCMPDLPTSIQLPVPILAPLNINKKTNIANFQLKNNEKLEPQINYVYKMAYSNQFNTQPAKRGRKKKEKNKKPQKLEEEKAPKNLNPAPRTRSGRIVKFPKHFKRDFKKLEINETKKSAENGEEEIETSDFATFKEESPVNPPKLPHLHLHQRKRKIAAQYRCPKCSKAYLGKTKMIQHIKKYPDHGPLPEKETKVNFEVWNYLVDITQKCSRAQKGIKFCEELTNLLHNVMLLTSALFKKVEQNKNFVEVDKVLGNAIGLSPGFYSFNESELYKDVTVLKLITNTDFFKPVDSTESQKEIPKNINIKVDSNTLEVNEVHFEKPMKMERKEKLYFNAQEDLSKNSPNYCIPRAQIESKITVVLEDIPDDYGKKDEPYANSDLLSDNSLLHLPNIRNSVDELLLTSVDPVGTLLDNSTSSDEVMNVDQFVNERFKKITEPDLELGSSSLNLDLPTLDLFQFHTT